MSDKRKEVRQAKDIFERRHTFDQEQQGRAIDLLAQHKDDDGAPLWSMAQIAAIAGVKKTDVYKRVTKAEHTGGRFNPAHFDRVLEEIALKDQNDSNRALTHSILAGGWSSYMLAKLIGQPVSSVKWRAAEYRKTLAAVA